MNTYGIELKASETLKSSWKKHVKQKIKEKMEREIRDRCLKMSKGRTVKNDKYEKKKYFSMMNMTEMKQVIRVRMHMSKLPGNYKEGGDGMCPLCNEEKGSTEHYFECTNTKRLAGEWGAKKEHLVSQEPNVMKRVANFIEKVEIMLQPMMENRLNTVRSRR